MSVIAGGVNTSETGDDDVVADGASVSDPHAASVMTNDAAQAAIATEAIRGKFTVVTLPPVRIDPSGPLDCA